MASELTDRASDEEIERLSNAIQEQRAEVCAYLARKLGGDPVDYGAQRYFAERDN